MNVDVLGQTLTEQLEQVLWTARSAGSTLIISRAQHPDAVGWMMREGWVRERLGHLVLTPKGHAHRRACAPY
ncbi:hypothetical protein [Sphingomonas sp. BK235]|jgi:hypothetical protein|uniref:hypothetical protein n=1 Tax=Sphingomonas sp. BK235 TaxID=2512131 RepID=UPI00104606A2|nr:hypothetical protein [Sphingomonas sp. BK235]TCP33163.1 hypothetical protein EV292_106105 [Sphingomonas sp. BK235]